MPDELLQNIQDLNARNHGAPSDPPSPDAAADPTALLQELRQRLLGQIRRRVDRAVTHFSERLSALAESRPDTPPPPDPAPAPSSPRTEREDPLQKTQEIDYTGEEELAGEAVSERQWIEGKSSPELIKELGETRELLARLPGPQDLADQVRDAVRDELRQRPAVEGNSTERSVAAEAAVEVWGRQIVRRQLEILDQLGDQSGPDPALVATLLDRIDELDQRLSARGVASGGGTEDEQTIVMKVEGDLASELKEIRKSLASLEQRMSDHFAAGEELAERTSATIESVLEAVTSVDATDAPSVSPELVARLETALLDLDELKSLPDRIRTLVAAGDAIDRFNLNSIIQEAADRIIERLDPSARGDDASPESPGSAS